MTRPRVLPLALAVAAVLLPTVAHAASTATNQSISIEDPAADVRDYRAHKITDKRPSLDVLSVQGDLTDERVTIVVKYAVLDKTPRTRRVVNLWTFGWKDNLSRATRLEYKVKPDRTVAVHAYRVISGGPTTVSAIDCSGLKVRPDFTADTLTYVLPLACWKARDPSGTTLEAASGQWVASRWATGNFEVMSKYADYADSADDYWEWTPTSEG